MSEFVGDGERRRETVILDYGTRSGLAHRAQLS